MDKNNRGNPRGRGQYSGGNRRALRDAQRAYNHQVDARLQQDWSYQPDEFDPTREPIQTVVPSTTSTPHRDEPLYDVGPHSSLLAVQDVYCQNFEFSGFIPLVNETYEKMRGIDPRLHERLPLSMFTHAMSVHLNLEILETARQAGQNVLNLRTDAREVLPDYQALPQSIVDYISHVASVITQDGKEVKLNLPAAAIPQGPIRVDGVEHPSGSFGPITAENHNSYECYIATLVTARRVIASQENNVGYLPLPEGLIPGNLVPNRNLLGFAIDIQGVGASSRLHGIQFIDDDTIEGRYKVSTLLQDRVYTVLAEMKDRFLRSQNSGVIRMKKVSML
ncbi:hypothetical protein ACJJTC_014684 [Scirpophaga incertulas]